MGFRKYSTDSKVTNIAELKIQQEKLALAQKEGEFWQCIGRKPDQDRGYIYHYVLKEEYRLKFGKYQLFFFEPPLDFKQKVLLKHEEIFPALEPIPYTKSLPIRNSAMKPHNLGYSFSESSLQLPDIEALESRLEKLWKKRPDLKPLQILSSEGVADDLSFIEAYLKYDVLLSTGKEFIHDHWFHVIPTIFMMLNCPQYFYERDRVREIISKVFYQILRAEEVIEKENLTELKSQLPKIKTAVGSVVDIIWAFFDEKSFKEFNYESFVRRFLEILESGLYQKFSNKSFGEKVGRASLTNTWNQITILAGKEEKT
jgi:hypothetical protein